MKMIYLILFINVIFFVSCNSPRYIYSPAPPNSPFFVSKGESKLAFYLSGGAGGHSAPGGKNGGFDLQAGYSIARNWAIIGSYYNRKEKDIYKPEQQYNYFDSSVIDYERHLSDIGAGYFIPLNPKKSIVFAMYGGVGFGKSSFRDDGLDHSGAHYSRTHSGNMTKWFFQQAVNFLPGRYFHFSLVGRCTFLRYRNIFSDYTIEETQYFDLGKLPRSTFIFFEPALIMQFGIPKCDWLKIDGGFTFASGSSISSNLQARSFNASLGLSLDLFKLKK